MHAYTRIYYSVWDSLIVGIPQTKSRPEEVWTCCWVRLMKVISLALSSAVGTDHKAIAYSGKFSQVQTFAKMPKWLLKKISQF